jgi:formylmethanofuran dehydrogenase subunit E
MQTLEEIAQFHGHTCPGLALGYRVSSCALQKLGDRSSDEELVALVENDSCAVDAVQVMTGCTFGKGNFLFLNHGKQVYTFIRRPTGEAIRISVIWTPPAETDGERAAWDAYSAGDRTEKVTKVVHARKGQKIQAIMDAKEEDLLKVETFTAEPPLKARLYPSIICALCGEKTMEPRARLMNGQTVCIPCFRGESAIKEK